MATNQPDTTRRQETDQERIARQRAEEAQKQQDVGTVNDPASRPNAPDGEENAPVQQDTTNQRTNRTNL